MKIKCPNKACKALLISIPIKDEEGTIRSIYIHPETISRCDYSQDGTQLEIIDQLLNTKFQELIKEEEEKKSKLRRLFEKWLI